MLFPGRGCQGTGGIFGYHYGNRTKNRRKPPGCAGKRFHLDNLALENREIHTLRELINAIFTPALILVNGTSGRVLLSDPGEFGVHLA